MSAWESPGAAAVHQLQQEPLELDDENARAAVETVFEKLAEPDRDMLGAGAAELIHALPKDTSLAYCRSLAAVVWRAMLARAR